MSKSEIIARYLRGQSLVRLFIQALALTTAVSRLKNQRDFIRDVAGADHSGIAEGVQKHPEFKIANSGACE
jgi:hypothetical protein